MRSILLLSKATLFLLAILVASTAAIPNPSLSTTTTSSPSSTVDEALSTTTPIPTSTPASSALSSGALAGIIIGSIALVGIVGLIVYLHQNGWPPLFPSRKRHDWQPDDDGEGSPKKSAIGRASTAARRASLKITRPGNVITKDYASMTDEEGHDGV
ncbi:hypothetical protein BT63DRAFT_415822 [Microthyrium microscopicum]|uniref:Mid2 domain-containing protein n=1 Tax=Microthyrium microscopicum TaxID=703497 RepID=A0A6A6U559_9PEZI|nr:hypothetical protein BT63DRAFT_415822 [Microthyrium microscopicum]